MLAFCERILASFSLSAVAFWVIIARDIMTIAAIIAATPK